MAIRALFFVLFVVSVSSVDSSSLSRASCPQRSPDFLDSIRAQCPFWIDITPPVEVDGESLRRELGQEAKGRAAHYSVLFYASWCPFSRNFKPMFETLSYMFPQITHLSVEESSAMPSLYSRYRIHSFPSLVLIRGSSKIIFTEPKSLSAIAEFYKRHTGFDPVGKIEIKPRNRVRRKRNSIRGRRESLRERINPHLAFSILFVLVKSVPCLKALWALHARTLKQTFVDQMEHILERAVNLLDAKRLWNEAKLFFDKRKNLKKGASNARVWASSLTSVSLGESSVRN